MMVTVPTEPDRYEPLPSLTELPSYLIRKASPRALALGGGLVVAAVVLVAVLVVSQSGSGSHDREAQAAQRAAASLAALKARYAREARPIAGSGPAGARALAPRRALMAGVEAAVLADARRRARTGELKGPYRSTICAKYPKGVKDLPPADDLGRAVAVVECIAVAAQVAPDARTTTGSLIGQPYRARVDFRTGRYAFCKIVQQPGELSIQRDSVLKVPAACGG